MKSQQLRCLLNNFYSSLNSYLYNHQGNHSEKILHELELIKLDSIEKINASKSATCSELNNTLRNIPVKLAPLDTIVEQISNLVIWYEASRGVPDFFKGGYAFAEIIGKRGLMVSNHIRLGLYIQKPEINYPLHAHDAEESYLILSGNTDWQIENKKFRVGPGCIVHHHSSEAHGTHTNKEPLLAVWIWTGQIDGRYWFSGHSEKDFPPDY